MTATTDPSNSQDSPGYRELQVQRHRLSMPGAHPQQERDQVAEEVPIAMVYNGISHAVMMASPLDLEDFATGFSLSERIVDQPSQLYDIDISETCLDAPGGRGMELRLQIASECFARLKDKRRALAGRTGCGLCGTESLEALDLDLPFQTEELQISGPALLRAFAVMQARQTINAATGATHAAAWVSTEGGVTEVREDVGRHNALDKLIGALARSRQPRQPGYAIMSSRASYELVQKAARAHIPLLATVSAPTSLAVQMADKAGLTLVGFARPGGFVVYTHPHRVISA
jgi:FdhD protein